MLCFLIGIVVVVLFMGLCDWDKYSIGPAGLIGGCVVIIVALCCLSRPENSEYTTQTPQTYQLQELRENQYYNMNAKGNSISALIVDTDGSYAQQTFDEKKVKLQEGEKAEITVTKEKIKKQSRLDIIWFLPNEKSGKERVKNVVITVPKDSYITPEHTKEPFPVEEKQSANPKFCADCGTSLSLDCHYCSYCGTPIKK